jgi:hypothetical protein
VASGSTVINESIAIMQLGGKLERSSLAGTGGGVKLRTLLETTNDPGDPPRLAMQCTGGFGSVCNLVGDGTTD